MGKLLVAAWLAFSCAAFADDTASTQLASTSQAASNQLLTDKHYVNSDGRTIHSPSNPSPGKHLPVQPLTDGSFSFSQDRQGTCSHHGGVSTWLGN